MNDASLLRHVALARMSSPNASGQIYSELERQVRVHRFYYMEYYLVKERYLVELNKNVRRRTTETPAIVG